MSFLALVADHVALVIDDALNFEAASARRTPGAAPDLTNTLVAISSCGPPARRLGERAAGHALRCRRRGYYRRRRPSVALTPRLPDTKGFVQEEILVPPTARWPGRSSGRGSLWCSTNPTRRVSPEEYRLIAGRASSPAAFLPSSVESILGVWARRQTEYAFRQEEVAFSPGRQSGGDRRRERARLWQIAALKDQLAQEKL